MSDLRIDISYPAIMAVEVIDGVESRGRTDVHLHVHLHVQDRAEDRIDLRGKVVGWLEWDGKRWVSLSKGLAE